MANGDAAAAAGLETVPPTGPSGKARLGYDWINYALDRIVTRVFPTAQIADGAITLDKLAAAVKAAWAAKVHSHTIDEVKTSDGSGPYAAALQTFLTDTYYPRALGASIYEGNLSAAIYSRAIGGNSVYITSGGVLGHVASAARFKQDVTPATDPDAPITVDADAARRIAVVCYTYIPELGLGDAPEVGVIAEQLEAAGFAWLVGYADNGDTLTVHYDRLALPALVLAQHNADRLDQLEARIAALEGAGA